MAEAQRDMSKGTNGARPPASAVGTLLRQARERNGLSLAGAAQQLRIRDSYLRAIEEGDFRVLPGATYAVGFLRSYADHLGLDPQEIVRRFREEVEELGRRTQLVFPAAPAEGKIPGGAILMIAVVVALVGYGGWYFLSERDGGLADLVPGVPPANEQTLAEPSEPATAPAAAEVASEPASTTTAPPSAASADLNSAVAQAVAAAVPAAPSGAEAATPEPVDPAASESPSAAETESAATTMIDPATSETDRGVETVPPSGDLAAAETSPPLETAEIEETADAVPETPPEVTRSAAAETGLPEEPAVPMPEASADQTIASPPPPETGAAEPAGDATVGTAIASGTDGIPPSPELPNATENLPEGQQYGVTNADARVVLIATQEAWVQIKKASGEEVWTKVLRPGDRFMVPNERGLVMATGNAGALQVVVDGRPVEALGPIGVVRRGILLDPQRLIDGTAAP